MPKTTYKCGKCKGSGYVNQLGRQVVCRVCNGSGTITVEWKEPDGR